MGVIGKRLLTQTLPIIKIDCSALRAPTIAAHIRNPAYRPTCSYESARQISVCLRMQACSVTWLLSRVFIVNMTEKGFF